MSYKSESIRKSRFYVMKKIVGGEWRTCGLPRTYMSACEEVERLRYEPFYGEVGCEYKVLHEELVEDGKEKKSGND